MKYSGREQSNVTTGWHANIPVAMPHLCFPPQGYPTGVGPGSYWRCPDGSCRQSWISSGIRIVGKNEYPVATARNDVILGPDRWKPTGMMQKDVGVLDVEASLYDWRPISPYYIKLWRLQLEAAGIDWRSLPD